VSKNTPLAPLKRGMHSAQKNKIVFYSKKYDSKTKNKMHAVSSSPLERGRMDSVL
jgi:hypothetical protein